MNESMRSAVVAPKLRGALLWGCAMWVGLLACSEKTPRPLGPSQPQPSSSAGAPDSRRYAACDDLGRAEDATAWSLGLGLASGVLLASGGGVLVGGAMSPGPIDGSAAGAGTALGIAGVAAAAGAIYAAAVAADRHEAAHRMMRYSRAWGGCVDAADDEPPGPADGQPPAQLATHPGGKVEAPPATQAPVSASASPSATAPPSESPPAPSNSGATPVSSAKPGNPTTPAQ
jgi:hypothetical protein